MTPDAVDQCVDPPETLDRRTDERPWCLVILQRTVNGGYGYALVPQGPLVSGQFFRSSAVDDDRSPLAQGEGRMRDRFPGKTPR